MEKQYYYLDEGEQFGPFILAEIRDMHIPPNILVWYEGMADWQPAETLPELQDLYQAPPVQHRQPTVVRKNPVARFFRIVFAIICLLLAIGMVGSGLENEPIESAPFILAVVFLALGLFLLLKKSKAKRARNNTDNQNEIDGMLYAQGMNAANPGWEDNDSDDGGDFD